MHRMTRREPTPIRPIRVGDPTARPLDSFRSIGADRQQLSCGLTKRKKDGPAEHAGTTMVACTCVRAWCVVPRSFLSPSSKKKDHFFTHHSNSKHCCFCMGQRSV